MTSDQFQSVIEEQMKICCDTLGIKAKEYATADRLHNFKVAAALGGKTTLQALAGMMAKHTVSIYDMCESKEMFSKALWNEKITDHINYLLLLKALVIEDMNERICSIDQATAALLEDDLK